MKCRNLSHEGRSYYKKDRQDGTQVDRQINEYKAFTHTQTDRQINRLLNADRQTDTDADRHAGR